MCLFCYAYLISHVPPAVLTGLRSMVASIPLVLSFLLLVLMIAMVSLCYVVWGWVDGGGGHGLGEE